MYQVRIHGRGGQGVVTAAEMLSVAAFHEGRFAQAFPSFGSERTGAPVVSYCRLADAPIRTREPIGAPDAVVVQDPTVLALPGVLAGISDETRVVVNSSRDASELAGSSWAREIGRGRLHVVPATEIARRHLGRPLPNTALLGAFAAITREVSLAAVERAIGATFSGDIAEANAAAARAAYAWAESEERRRVAAD